MSGEQTVEPGVIILIGPGWINPAMAGCLAVVQDVKSWGVKADVIGPGNSSAGPPGVYPVRVEWEHVIPTGGRMPTADDLIAGDGHNPGPAVCRCETPATIERPAGYECGYCGGSVTRAERR